MQQPWTIERRRLLALVVTVLVLGFLSGHWVVSILVPAAVYIGLQLLQLYRLETWLRRGFKPRDVPDTSGAWESIIAQILKIRKSDKELQKRLARTAKSYRNTVKALPDAAIVVNHKLEIEWSNQVAQRYLGISPKQDLGYRVTNLIRDPAFIEYLARPGDKALEFVSPVNPELILAIRVIQYGQEEQRLILGRDISERVQVRNALKAFISNASHELRTPLTVTSGYIDLLREDPALPPHMREPLEQLHDQTSHMTQLINDLLVLSQLEGDSLAEYEGRKINVPELLDQLVQNLADSGISGNHRVQLEVNPRLGLLGIKRECLSICSNLIENALKYTPAGSQVRVRWFANKAGQPCLAVSDDGPGIETELIPKLTQRFYRVDHPRHQAIDGTGLGLAIVKHAVMRHGGELVIWSAPGQGAEFKVRFPASRRVKLKK